MATILQHPLLTDFLYPLLLVFFIVFAILEKTNLLGQQKKQLNAVISLVIGLIFVSAVFPKIVVGNLILFLSVGLVVIFIGMLLWGFVSGEGVIANKGMKKFLAAIIIIAVVLALIGATGFGGGIENIFTNAFDFLFNSNWSGGFWTNFLIIAIVIGSILIAIGIKKTVPASSS